MKKIPENIGSKYRYIIIAAERAKQLQSNAKPKIKTKSTKPSFIAMKEVQEGLIGWETVEIPHP
jgi:DNA-directed RNA polymerase subunit omega